MVPLSYIYLVMLCIYLQWKQVTNCIAKSKAYLLGKPPLDPSRFCCGSRELLSGDANGCFQPTERGAVGEVFQGLGGGGG